MEIFKNISTVLGVALSSLTLLGILIKGPKKFFAGWLTKAKQDTMRKAEQEICNKLDTRFTSIENKLETIAKDNSKQVEILEQKLEHTNSLLGKSIESQQQVLRSNLTKLYDKAIQRGYLTFYEKKNMIMEYNIYSNVLGGNSFAETIVSELMKLPVKEEKE